MIKQLLITILVSAGLSAGIRAHDLPVLFRLPGADAVKSQLIIRDNLLIAETTFLVQTDALAVFDYYRQLMEILEWQTVNHAAGAAAMLNDSYSYGDMHLAVTALPAEANRGTLATVRLSLQHAEMHRIGLSPELSALHPYARRLDASQHISGGARRQFVNYSTSDPPGVFFAVIEPRLKRNGWHGNLLMDTLRKYSGGEDLMRIYASTKGSLAVVAAPSDSGQWTYRIILNEKQ